jgi:GNAT superfamily N-acetyltransferase
MPAVKIGRLGINVLIQRRGIGTELLDFIKYWFTHGNKTGCRFVIVDAYNKENVINFYERNGFKFLLTDDDKDSTRLMYFD